jgi:hypothetical protein
LACRLFSKEKSGIQVAINLNLTGPEVTLYQRALEGNALSDLNSIYRETMGNIGHVVMTYRQMNEKGANRQELFKALEVMTLTTYNKRTNCLNRSYNHLKVKYIRRRDDIWQV